MAGTLSLLGLAALLLSACAGLSSGPGPSAWIDYPADGAALQPGQILVVVHASGPAPIAQFDLYVNGELQAGGIEPVSAQGLAGISTAWEPAGPGKYSLYVVARDGAGAEGRSLPVQIVIVGEGPPATPSPTAAQATETATVTPTGTAGGPSATLLQDSNCRLGPGMAYGSDDVVLADAILPIEGRSADSSWWWVLRSAGRHCWLSASTIAVSGDLSAVPVVAAPPLPAQTETVAGPPPEPGDDSQPPEAPNNVHVSQHVCQGTTYSVTLAWQDAANNEDGYRIYRNNVLIATIGENATTFTDNPPQGGPYTYKVEAYNTAGSGSATTTDPGCVL